jgi:Cytochrome P450
MRGCGNWRRRSCCSECATTQLTSLDHARACVRGCRKCVGDQFALMEAVIALAVNLKRFDFELVPNQEIGMTTGATIHTTNGLYMRVTNRGSGPTNAAESATAVTVS